MESLKFDEFKTGRRLLGSLPHRQDLIKSIEAFCKAASVQMAVFAISGAVSSVTLGTYDQKQQVYVTCKKEEPFEIVNCTGNLSLKGGDPFILASGVFANEQGAVIGGRIFSETILFAAEIDLTELRGKPLDRKYEHRTGLLLW
jgi:predicted DNA-binding protein with PD1-like motif